MGNHVGRREHTDDLSAKNTDNSVVEETPVSQVAESSQECDDNEVFVCNHGDQGRAGDVTSGTTVGPGPEVPLQDGGQGPGDTLELHKEDVNQNNGTSSKGTAVTDSTGTEETKNDWKDANPADAAARPHLIRLFSRDAPGREDNTFKDRPSESDELQTIPEDSGTTSPETDLMASQKLSRGHGSKHMASASTSDHSRHGHGAHGRYRDSGLLDSLGRFFGGDRHIPRKGSGKDIHYSRSGYLSSSPQRSPQRSSYYAHGRHVDENPVVHFFRNIVTPRTPPLAQPKRGLSLARFSWGGEGHKGSYGGSSPRFLEHHHQHHHKSSFKGYKDAHREGQGTLSRIFKLGGRDSRSSSPMARR
ncbi:myelin basic protein isoform X2 [Pseudophryne corroboree]|uniref:myelin basic protein isoform X2 n=1 Tax=Pseudophryne corroboree TaxID=495146 RepID=UPI0030821170